MGNEGDPVGPSLRVAIELVAALTQSGSDPGFYGAVQRVMGDVTALDGGPEALAELIFGLSSLERSSSTASRPSPARTRRGC